MCFHHVHNHKLTTSLSLSLSLSQILSHTQHRLREKRKRSRKTKNIGGGVCRKGKSGERGNARKKMSNVCPWLLRLLQSHLLLSITAKSKPHALLFFFPLHWAIEGPLTILLFFRFLLYSVSSFFIYWKCVLFEAFSWLQYGLMDSALYVLTSSVGNN